MEGSVVEENLGKNVRLEVKGQRSDVGKNRFEAGGQRLEI
jgi:hypothetical protein